MMAAPGSARAGWLLVRLRLRRMVNQIGSIRFGGKRKRTARRVATPAKRGLGWLVAALVVVAMSFSFMNIERQSILNLECVLAPATGCASLNPRGHHDFAPAVQALAERGVDHALARALALQLSLLFATSVLVPLGSREMAAAGWDLEWLVTLPLKRSVLLAARVAERSVANPTGLLTLVPPGVMIAWYAGFRWSAPLVGIAGALALLPIGAVLRTIADTGLRMSLSPAKLRNLQALCSLASLPFLYIAMSFGMPSGGALIESIHAFLPGWLMWTPPGLVVSAITAPTAGAAAAASALLVFELAAALVAGLALLRHQLRDGVVASGVRESVRSAAPRAPSAGAAFWERLLPRSPVQRRELRLLSRDRNFLVQSLVMPLVIVGSQVLVNARPGSAGALASSPVALALTAWGISAYMLMLSAFQTLNSEGQVLWMLYTFPRSIERILADKAKMWAVLALIYPLAVFAFGFAVARSFDWRSVSTLAIVLAGIPIFSVIAVALGVFGCDPLGQDTRNRVRPSYIYLYMLLVSLYAYAIAAEKWFQTAAFVVLTGCLAQALWQKARDALPYLLDPAASPPSRVSTADGMMAAMLFFVLQALAYYLLSRASGALGEAALVVAFLVAGAATYLLVRLVYWRSKTSGVPAVFRGGVAKTLGWGLGGGLLAGGVALVYMALLRGTPWWNDMMGNGVPAGMQARWLFPLAVLLAPLFEEFIFRGLIFGGLRRSMAVLPAMLMSAALFAIVHPPVSMLPVFGLGLCAAWAYERNKGLAAPMLVHAVYNAIVLGYQM